jgi:hypothetical protein
VSAGRFWRLSSRRIMSRTVRAIVAWERLSLSAWARSSVSAA